MAHDSTALLRPSVQKWDRCDWRPRFRWAEELAWTNWTLADFDAAVPKNYPLVNIQKAMEHGHRNSGFSHEKHGGSFHCKMLVHQRVSTVSTATRNFRVPALGWPAFASTEVTPFASEGVSSAQNFVPSGCLTLGFQWVAKEWKTQIPTWQSFSARQWRQLRRRSRLEVLGSPKIAGWCSISWLVQYRSTSKLRSSVCKAFGDGRFKISSWTMELVFPN